MISARRSFGAVNVRDGAAALRPPPVRDPCSVNSKLLGPPRNVHGTQLVAVDGDEPTARPRSKSRYAHAGLHRRVVVARVRLEVRDHLRERSKCAGGGAVVVKAGKPLSPVRRVQVEPVPALRAPGLADAAALLEDDVLTATLREEIARGEAGLPRP
jgi:hypothetical protein